MPSGPWIKASQWYMSSSVTGPAVMPSGGFVERFLYSWKRRFCATDDMVVSEVVRLSLRVLGREEVVSMCLVDHCTDNGLMVLPRRWGGGNVEGWFGSVW